MKETFLRQGRLELFSHTIVLNAIRQAIVWNRYRNPPIFRRYYRSLLNQWYRKYLAYHPSWSMILHIILIVVLVRLEYTLHLQEYPTCILCVLAAFGFHQAHMHSQLHHFPSKFIISYFVTCFNTRSQKQIYKYNCWILCNVLFLTFQHSVIKVTLSVIKVTLEIPTPYLNN